MSSLSPPSKSPRRRRKHSSSSRDNKATAARNKMAIIEPPSPCSPFSWRLERKTSPSKKSHGVSPAQFHVKPEDRAIYFDKVKNDKDESSLSPASWKEQVVRNLLIQEQKTFTKELEAKRKGFRRITQLKTWPLQDMA